MLQKKSQLELCRKYGLKDIPPEEMVAVAMSTLGKMPIYGNRVQMPENGNVSWFFHCGEYSDREDFFSAVHTEHLNELLPLVIPYLHLPHQKLNLLLMIKGMRMYGQNRQLNKISSLFLKGKEYRNKFEHCY